MARRRTEADKLGKRIQTALKHAGIVEGYLHLCRRCKAKGKPHEEQHADNERRECPVCGMALWAKPIPKRLRLHDTRPTTATLLLEAGADLYAVARILRHTDPKVTFETYAHLVPGYLQAQVDKLSVAVPPTSLALYCPQAHRTLPLTPKGLRKKAPKTAISNGAPGRSRTCGPRLRSSS
jgi:integrase